jgi:hypothetical protein
MAQRFLANGENTYFLHVALLALEWKTWYTKPT